MTTTGDVPTIDSAVSVQQGAVDWSVLDAYAVLQKPGAPDLRRRLMIVYLNSSSVLMEEIKTSIMGADGPSLALAAHSLKSSSLSVGAIGVGSLCAELEQIGRNNTLHKAGDLLSRAEAQYAAVHAAFIDALQQSGK